MNQQQLPAGIDLFYKKNSLRIEIILAIVAIAGLILSYLQIGGSAALIGISFSSLAVVYFMGAFQSPDDSDKTIALIIGYKVLHISWSVALMGFMYKLLQLPGSSAMTRIGLLSMIIALVMVIITGSKNWGNRETAALIRSLLIGSLLIL